MQPPNSSMVVGQDIAGYRVLAHIGSGAASELYCVQDPKSKQVWALKHVSKRSDKEQRFLDQVAHEYRIGSQLDHPNIRKVYRIIKHRKMFKVTDLSLLMELVDAETLDQYKPKSMLEAIEIFAQAARALAHMHDRGYVHADMKPSNVLVGSSHDIKIIDLGQACPIGTVKERIQGTPGYMAPEQAHRDAITPKTDIYNFGATMYWALVREVIPTAMPPKDDGSSLYSGAIDAGMVEPPKPPHEKNPDIHPLLSKLILHCVQLDPDDRPDSMDHVVDRLEFIADLLRDPAKDDSYDEENGAA